MKKYKATYSYHPTAEPTHTINVIARNKNEAYGKVISEIMKHKCYDDMIYNMNIKCIHKYHVKSCIVIAAGLFLIWGSIDACQLNDISLLQAIKQISMGTGISALGCITKRW